MAKGESRGEQVRKFVAKHANHTGGPRPVAPEPEAEPLDLIVRGGRVVTPDGVQVLDLGVRRGKIVRILPEINEEPLRTIDAGGRHVFPGIIDAHVHFNEPGRADWEGLAHGSLALAAGGGTCFFDMPLNSEPPVLDAATLREKRIIAGATACTDFGLWGGLVPGNLDKLAGMRDGGVVGLKAFMCNSGIDSFARADAKTLYEGMRRAAKLGLLVAAHAEDDALAAKFTAEQQAKGQHDAKAWLASRPVEVELAAIRQALEFAGETGCMLHIVHVSSPEGVALIADARAKRVDVTAETCPHYLLLNDKDVAKIGAAAKCAPPIRDEKRRKAMWAELRAENIQTVGSDHSPAPAEMKTSDNFFEIWGGIAGVQHGAPLLLNETIGTLAADWPRLAAVLARNVARRFRIGGKGLLAEGYDADFSLIKIEPKARVITPGDLWTHHPISAYIGRKSRVQVTDTYVRGVPVWANGNVVAGSPKGQFVRPQAG
jgi:allantoinase